MSVTFSDVESREWVLVSGKVSEGSRLVYRPAGIRPIRVSSILVQWRVGQSYPGVDLLGWAALWHRYPMTMMWRGEARSIRSEAQYAVAPEEIRAFAEAHRPLQDAAESTARPYGDDGGDVTLSTRSALVVVSGKLGDGEHWCWGAGEKSMIVESIEVRCEAGMAPLVDVRGRPVSRRSRWWRRSPRDVARAIQTGVELLAAPESVQKFFEEHGPIVEARANELAAQRVVA